ncbi:hypothetical protein [Methylobacterium oryzae]|jgi:hypothetical protein|uniref:Protein of unassigned function n=1 Tax=Methylobacterium oryzae CBMB20 TaxID=693986 RepID=A0A089NMK4_9HYPH|nr:hypothetical protein [Methylobacterium oryzae]AIQ88607.1 protein of unassigned function [Methylobacterium oryzae CBMB20]
MISARAQAIACLGLRTATKKQHVAEHAADRRSGNWGARGLSQASASENDAAPRSKAASKEEAP